MPSGKDADDKDINRANANRKKDSEGTSILKNLIYGKTPKVDPKKGSNKPKKKQ